MLQPGRCEDMMGQLGAFLATQNADSIEIIDEGTILSVSWRLYGTPQHRSFHGPDWERLRVAAQPSCPSLSCHAPLLGHLGREIDRAEIDVAHIVEEEDGFLVSGSANGKYRSMRFAFPQLKRQGVAEMAPEGFAPTVGQGSSATGPLSHHINGALSRSRLVPYSATGRLRYWS